MGLSVLILFFVPWLDRSKAKSIRYKGPLFKRWIATFVISFFVLGYLGTVHPIYGGNLVRLFR